MSLLLTLDPCGHRQMLVEVGENPPTIPDLPWVLYPMDADEANSIQPGNAMTCITCDETKIVRQAI
jgi:hypothetical protein